MWRVSRPRLAGVISHACLVPRLLKFPCPPCIPMLVRHTWHPRVSRQLQQCQKFLGSIGQWITRSWCMLMHHTRAGGKVEDSFSTAPSGPMRRFRAPTGCRLCRNNFLPDARTSGRGSSFSTFQAALLRPPSWGLRPVVAESCPPAAAEVQTPSRAKPPAPLRAQYCERHTCMRGVREPCTHASYPHRPAPPMQP